MDIPATDIKSNAALHEQRPFTRLKYDALKPQLLSHGRSHFISMQFDDWFETSFLDSSDDRWSKERAVEVKEYLRKGSTAVIDDSGWKALNQLIEGGAGENEAYTQLGAYFDDIAGAAEALSPDKKASRTTRYEYSSGSPGKAEVTVPDYKPDGRFTLTDAAPKLSQGEPRRFVNADCAGITQLNMRDGRADRAQVC
jgi:hypothetical protein